MVIDECHRGSAREDSAWREILDYFEPAIQLGLTATPKETRKVSTLTYFGDPVYIYTLKQGIDDGFLAPYKVVRIDLDKDRDVILYVQIRQRSHHGGCAVRELHLEMVTSFNNVEVCNYLATR